ASSPLDPQGHSDGPWTTRKKGLKMTKQLNSIIPYTQSPPSNDDLPELSLGAQLQADCDFIGGEGERDRNGFFHRFFSTGATAPRLQNPGMTSSPAHITRNCANA